MSAGAPGGLSPSPLAASPLAAAFTVGGVEIPNRIVLAPMAGLTTSAYRRHLKAHGVGMVTTEMISAYGLVYRNTRTERYLHFAPEERPVALQLFGDRPEIMARAAELVLSHLPVPDILDVNMGCPVRKVMKTGAGAALLGDPGRAVAVASAVVQVASQAGVPVTVKLRAGLNQGDRTAVDLAPRLEQAGVAALAVHPRAASEHYRGKADHLITAAVAEVVDIPVIASGDINGVEAALAVWEATGAAALMVARGVAGNPWLVGALLSGRRAAPPPLTEVVQDVRTLLSLAIREQGPERAIRWMRKLLGWYLRPLGFSPGIIQTLRELPDAVSLDAALSELAAGASEARAEG